MPDTESSVENKSPYFPHKLGTLQRERSEASPNETISSYHEALQGCQKKEISYLVPLPEHKAYYKALEDGSKLITFSEDDPSVGE